MGPLQNGVQLARQKGRLAVVVQPQRRMAAHQSDGRLRARRRVGVDFNPDRERLRGVRRQAQLKTRKTHQGAVDDMTVSDAQFDPVRFGRKRSANGLQVSPQLVFRRLALQGEIEVFRVTRQSEEESQAGSALQRQRCHRARALHRFQNAGLQVLASDVPPLQGIAFPNQRLKVILHSISYPGSRSARLRR